MFEANIRNIMKEYASRGKIDIYVSYEDLSETAVSLHYNQAMAEEYMQVFKKMQEDFNIETKITAEALAKYPEVVTIEEVQQDEEVWWELLEAALRQAAEKFVETRTIEGANLKRDLLGKLDQMAADVAFIEERSPQIIAEYRSKLEEKVKEFYRELKSTKERKEYIDRGSRLSYVHLLVNVKYAFMKSDFIWVCHELQDILHYEDIFQNRIKYNVLDLIEEYIGEK